MNHVKESKVWNGCEGCVCFEIPPLRITLSQAVEYIRQAPAEGRSVVGEMGVAEVQRSGRLGSFERSEITKRVKAAEEELRLMNQVLALDNRTGNGLV